MPHHARSRTVLTALALALGFTAAPALTACVQSEVCADGAGAASLTGLAWDRANDLVYLRVRHPQSYCTSNPEEYPYVHELITIHLTDGAVDFDARSSRSFVGDVFPDTAWPLFDDGGQPGVRLCSSCDITLAPPPVEGDTPAFELRVRSPLSLAPDAPEGSADALQVQVLQSAVRAFIIVQGDKPLVTLLSDYQRTWVYEP